jgi:hypothetical protein
MIDATTTLTKLLIVRDVVEDASGAVLRFHEGSQGRLDLSAANFATCLRLARRSQERQHPVGVSFRQGEFIANLLRSDNDVPTEIGVEGSHGARVLFQGHDGIFHLKADHPDVDRIRALLNESIQLMGRVWFVAHKPDLVLLDVQPVGWTIPYLLASNGVSTSKALQNSADEVSASL